ncbi:MAG: 2-oxoglutarate dehydrogenase E1 component [Taibaiella sp.]|nr:2-oxoglutarate dehydrogenase E1 component [Taibaiella sp.]
MKDFTFVTNSHPEYIENLYESYRANPDQVDPEFKKFFEGFDFAISKTGDGEAATMSAEQLYKEMKVYQFIRDFRKRGHLLAKTNPIRERIDRKPELDLSDFKLTEADLKERFAAGKHIGLENATLQEILDKLHKIYAGHVGIQYTYVVSVEEHDWIQRSFEDFMLEELPLDVQKRILEKLNYGVIFEKFLQTKFIGQKRFGLEGGESMIPGLDAIINTGSDGGVQEVIIGMAHRGRLNVLANILRKTYDQIFTEFEGIVPKDDQLGSGDVKYHLGYRSNIKTLNGNDVNVQLLPNPSHLEVVDPVVTGFARAKAEIIYGSEYDCVLPILIHGDAALAGQGVIYELLQMYKLNGYTVGGTIHFVVNNQIGFTTDFKDARSSAYCTSIASTIHAPVLHVNGDDPEAVVKACIFAVKYRQKFNKDVFIDMVCYRRHGHNEGDEPKFTQPMMYKTIEKHPNIRELYMKQLMDSGKEEVKQYATELEKKFWNELQDRLDENKQNKLPYQVQLPEKWWKELRKSAEADFEVQYDTKVSLERIKEVFNALMNFPEQIHPLRKITKLFGDKTKLFEEQQKIDWATGELMAYATLMQEGHDVRISGEDVERGTFSHRHAVIVDENSGEKYNRLSQVPDSKGDFYIFNSLLSEYAVLGFEYGYAMANPNNLVLWEAQYGDFVNGAQMVIDQYITSAEAKWNLQNGMVMLLPHGYEGGGPDHSSARMERFLQNAAEQNIIVTNITTASNFFHGLRRQMKFPFRKPMVNFSPKANLRHERSYSDIEELANRGFQEVIDDEFIKDPSKVKRVLLCSGKVYFDLSDKQIAEEREDVAVIRMEQIYPLPMKQLQAVYEKYRSAQWLWVQEEPRNMGAASFLKMNLTGINLGYLTRQASAATSTGFAKKHIEEQKMLVEEAFCHIDLVNKQVSDLREPLCLWGSFFLGFNPSPKSTPVPDSWSGSKEYAISWNYPLKQNPEALVI